MTVSQVNFSPSFCSFLLLLISFFSQAVFGDPRLPEDEREIVGVVAVDYTYENFHRDFTTQTGCAYNKTFVGPGVPLCYVMDNSALVILAPRFLYDEFDSVNNVVTESNVLYIGQAIPGKGIKGIFLALFFIDFFFIFRAWRPVG